MSGRRSQAAAWRPFAANPRDAALRGSPTSMRAITAPPFLGPCGASHRRAPPSVSPLAALAGDFARRPSGLGSGSPSASLRSALSSGLGCASTWLVTLATHQSRGPPLRSVLHEGGAPFALRAHCNCAGPAAPARGRRLGACFARRPSGCARPARGSPPPHARPGGRGVRRGSGVFTPRPIRVTADGT